MKAIKRGVLDKIKKLVCGQSLAGTIKHFRLIFEGAPLNRASTQQGVHLTGRPLNRVST